jgi:hypothetical protein
VILQLPRDRAFLPLLHMVLGGIGLRHDLSFDALDDVQLAVDNILAEDPNPLGELSVDVAVGDGYLDISIASLEDRELEYQLREGRVRPGHESRCIDVCLLLRSLVDEYHVRDLEEGRYAVDIRKVIR